MNQIEAQPLQIEARVLQIEARLFQIDGFSSYVDAFFNQLESSESCRDCAKQHQNEALKLHVVAVVTIATAAGSGAVIYT